MIFDSHLHIIDPRFPLIANHGFLPDAFSCAEYRAQVENLGVTGGCVVSGSFQGFDQGYLRAALATLGACFAGVAQLPTSVSDAEILALNDAGVRAIRFNLRRSEGIDMSVLPTLAQRVHRLAGWHVEVYIDGAELFEHLRFLLGLPRVVIDHLGLSRDGLPSLYTLVERGALVKASGFGRLDFNPLPVMQRIVEINPRALMFGTDLPSTRAPRPFMERDLRLIEENFDARIARLILHDNAVNLYRPKGIAPP
jgi:predicted TIM-barrel fold metal-dependent hydrolase